MKTFREEWIVIVNKTKYTLNEKQAHILKEAIASGSRGIVVFDEFSISIPYIEEFYLSEKVFDVLPELSFENEQIISEEEKKRTRIKIDAFRQSFFNKHKISQPKTEEEINERRNKLLDQLKLN